MYDLTFRRTIDRDKDFLFSLKKATLKDYITATWGGWDEKWQWNYFNETFDPARQQIIQVDDEDIGVLAVYHETNRVFLANIGILPEYQNRGIGSYLMGNVMHEAAMKGQPVELQVLRINPAVNLYKKLGFAVINETATHYFMQWRAGTACVVKAYNAAYDNGVTFYKGDRISIYEKSGGWPGWRWGTDRNGDGAWIPESFIEKRESEYIMKCHYDATELTVAAGDELTVVEEEAGWLRCLDNQGRVGWIPKENAEIRGEK